MKNDTTIDQVYRQRLMSLTPTERLKLGTNMFSEAKSLILLSMKKLEPNLIKERLLKKFYGSEFSTQEIIEILKFLEFEK